MWAVAVLKISVSILDEDHCGIGQESWQGWVGDPVGVKIDDQVRVSGWHTRGSMALGPESR